MLMPRGAPNKPALGDRVTVQFGRETRRGVLVGLSDHPAFGRVADVRHDDGTVTRYVADRVSRDAGPAPASGDR